MENEKYTLMYGDSFPNKIVITMNNGATHEKEILDPKGHPNNPLTREELENKFKDAAAPLLSEERQNRIIDTLWNLEQLQNIEELMKMLEVK